MVQDVTTLLKGTTGFWFDKSSKLRFTAEIGIPETAMNVVDSDTDTIHQKCVSLTQMDLTKAIKRLRYHGAWY